VVVARPYMSAIFSEWDPTDLPYALRRQRVAGRSIVAA
jgi:hypothetical protein